MSILCWPKFKDQIHLLRLYLPWMENLAQTDFKPPSINGENFVLAFQKAAEHIRKSDIKLEWFISEVFSKPEIDEFVKAFKFMLLKRLEMSYVCVCADLIKTLKALSFLDFPVSIRYSINYLNCTFESDVIPTANPQSFRIPETVPALFQSQDKQILDMLAEDVYKVRLERSEAVAQSFTSVDDIRMTTQETMKSSDQNIKTSITAKGEGGTMELSLTRLNVGRMRVNLIGSYILLVCACAIFLFCFLKVLDKGKFWNIVFSAFIGWFVLSILWQKCVYEKQEINNYERKKRNWLGKVHTEHSRTTLS